LAILIGNWVVGVIERAWAEATKDGERWQVERKMMEKLQLAEL
jgi:hypothetical protein